VHSCTLSPPTTMDHLKKLGNKGWAALDVVGQKGNRLANKLGAESFWPMSLDKECDKAAAILRSFTRDGFQVNSKDRNGNNTKSIVKIPPKVLQQAKGLAIFTVFRTGFHISGAGGSGILIARQPDGTFGPPSGIYLHTLGVGFLIGMDVYDTVLILRTQEAVNAFAYAKISIGAELSVAAGPLGSGGALDVGLGDGSPAWVYTKSKGFYAGIALDGTVVVERKDENERFYGRKIKAGELIKGGAKRPSSTDGLIATIEMAEGKPAREDMIPTGLSPSEQAEVMEPPTPESSHTESDGAPPLPSNSAESATRISEQPTASSSRISEPGSASGLYAPPLLPARQSSQQDVLSPPDDKPESLYEDAPPPYDSDEDISIGNRQTTEKGQW